MTGWFRALAAAAALGFVMSAGAQAVPDAREARALHSLFDREWEEEARAHPEESTSLGDFRYNDMLTDMSAAGIEARDARDRAFLDAARKIRRDLLTHSDRISLDLFVEALGQRVEEQGLGGFRTLRVFALGGAQDELSSLVREAPVDTATHVEQLLKRYAAYSRKVDDEIALMRRGIGQGWVPSRNVLQRALAMLDVQLAKSVGDSPLFEPFTKMGPSIGAADQSRLQAAGRQAVESNVVPALRRLRDFIAGDYMAAAPEDGSLARYPDGARVYAFLARRGTTTRLAPAAMHEMGLRELASIRAEMEGIMRKAGFTGTVRDFAKTLYSDPKYLNASPGAQLDMYRAIGKRVDAELPRFFAELPRMTYGVRAMPEFAGPDAAEYYSPPAVDGTRPGYFNANAQGFRTRPAWTMATLLAHEAVPGHHLQFARAQELKDLPLFQRTYEWNAFSEGWAVYAETVAREMGIFDDPHSLFGHLQARAFRASRLVVDTGIHAYGWPRRKAIDFLVDQTGLDPDFASSEVDRYTSYGGQALGYMVGALKIRELRERAEARLGHRFDLRRFHNAVLDHGSLPLDVLEREVDAWIAEQQRAKPLTSGGTSP